MSKKWIIDKGLLCISDDKDFKYIPCSTEIFYYVFGGEKPINYKIPEDVIDLNKQFPDIRFSKIAAHPKVLLYIRDHQILNEVFIEKAGARYKVSLPVNGGKDHIIIDKKWNYLSSVYNDIAELFSLCGIYNESVKFSSYIKILNAQKEFSSVEIINEVNDNIKNLFSLDKKGIPSCLEANLYPYQETGFSWLKHITDDNCGCILGDEMGLGKTLQVITLFASRNPYKQAPFLVVAPVSLLENWKREINKFAPALTAFIHHGQKRTGFYKQLLQGL